MQNEKCKKEDSGSSFLHFSLPPKHAGIICMRILVFLLLTSPAIAADLQVGAASTVITPPEGTPLAGYYGFRGTKTVLDDIHAKAIVLQVGDTKAALVVCDLISLPRHVVTEARRQIEAVTGIPGAHVMISATHTHTAPVINRESSLDELIGATSELGQRYTEKLPELIAKSVIDANKKLAPARASSALGKEEGVSFNRRFHMKDGTVSWNPAKRNPDIVRPAGPIDPDVGVVYFDSPKNAPIATYVNFAMHPDTVGGEGVSADYPGVLAKRLAEYRGPDMVTVFANGCCGNINHRNITWLDGQKGPTEANRIGTLLAASVLRTTPNLKPLSADRLQIRSEIVKLPLAPINDADVMTAKDVVKRVKEPATKFMDKVKAFQVLDVVARAGKPLEVEVQVITLGDQLAWVSLPGEIFVELGQAIKKASPYSHTMIAELANGSIGYIPDKAAYPQGNYEVVSARCAQGSGEMLVEAAVRLLGQMKKAK
jgi:neutral ceramidase